MVSLCHRGRVAESPRVRLDSDFSYFGTKVSELSEELVRYRFVSELSRLVNSRLAAIVIAEVVLVVIGVYGYTSTYSLNPNH